MTFSAVKEYHNKKIPTKETNTLGEIRKCGFWCKLPLFDHFCGAPTQMMKIRDFLIYPYTNDLLPSSLYNLV